MKSIRRALARLFRRPAVSGPYRIYVRPTPTGVVLDVEHYTAALVLDLADNHLDALLEIAEERAAGRPYDAYAPEPLLLERLVSDLGYELPVYGGQVDRLITELENLAPPVSAFVPAPRAAGGAA